MLRNPKTLDFQQVAVAKKPRLINKKGLVYQQPPQPGACFVKDRGLPKQSSRGTFPSAKGRIDGELRKWHENCDGPWEVCCCFKLTKKNTSLKLQNFCAKKKNEIWQVDVLKMPLLMFLLVLESFRNHFSLVSSAQTDGEIPEAHCTVLCES